MVGLVGRRQRDAEQAALAVAVDPVDRADVVDRARRRDVLDPVAVALADQRRAVGQEGEAPGHLEAGGDDAVDGCAEHRARRRRKRSSTSTSCADGAGVDGRCPGRRVCRRPTTRCTPSRPTMSSAAAMVAGEGLIPRASRQSGQIATDHAPGVSRSLGSLPWTASTPTSCSRVRASRASVSSGAVATLAEAGYRFPRVAGHVGRRGRRGVRRRAAARGGAAVPPRGHRPVAQLRQDARPRSRRPGGGPLARVVDGLSLAFDGGVFEGDYLRAWVAGSLADLGVRTFGDLRVADDGQLAARRAALLPGRDGQRRLAQATGALALGLSALRARPRRAVGRRRRARVGLDPVLLRAGDASIARRVGQDGRLDDGRRQRAVQLPRRRCSTAPTSGRRGGRRSASGCRCARPAACRPTRCGAPSRSPCPWSRPCSRPATRNTSTIRACRRAASSSTPRVCHRSTSASPRSSRSCCSRPGAQAAVRLSAGLGLRWLPAHLPRASRRRL